MRRFAATSLGVVGLGAHVSRDGEIEGAQEAELGKPSGAKRQLRGAGRAFHVGIGRDGTAKASGERGRIEAHLSW